MRKKSLSKRIVLTLVVVLGMFVLWGCGDKDVADKNKDPNAALKERGSVVMGLDDTFAPMGFRDKNNEIVGFDVDLANEVFKRIGIEVKFQQIDWTMKETELKSGNIDVIWNGYTITEERKAKGVAFTQPYLENRQWVITLADSAINCKADLEGKRVAIQNESSAVDAVNTEPELVASFAGGEPILFDTNNEAFMDLEAKRADAVVADEVLARYYIKLRGVEKYKVLEEHFGEEEYGIGVRKDDVELLEAIDNALNELREDGTYEKIYQKWFAE
ncbi:MAG: amino acid ABC transporter substrate-binding protein [Desulfitobacteriaceae bacterium]|nr:amino acid ABC transporter substrate-binding protein [Desulfitobacteriaceae bacterium]